MNPVVHFEMPYSDRDRAARFYEQTFGWYTQGFGPEMGNYLLAKTCKVDADGRPVETGMINGGFFPRREDRPTNSPMVVIAVENMAEAVSKVESGGGTMLGTPIEIPGVGLYVSFRDTEGNQAAMLQPIAM